MGYVQVLMYDSTGHVGRLKRAVRAASAADMPEGCTRCVYVVDKLRCLSFPNSQ